MIQLSPVPWIPAALLLGISASVAAPLQNYRCADPASHVSNCFAPLESSSPCGVLYSKVDRSLTRQVYYLAKEEPHEDRKRRTACCSELQPFCKRAGDTCSEEKGNHEQVGLLPSRCSEGPPGVLHKEAGTVSSSSWVGGVPSRRGSVGDEIGRRSSLLGFQGLELRGGAGGGGGAAGGRSGRGGGGVDGATGGVEAPRGLGGGGGVLLSPGADGQVSEVMCGSIPCCGEGLG